VGASSIGGVWKIAIFGQYIALSRKWYQIEPWLLWDANRKPYPSFRSFNDLVRVTLKHLAKSSVTRSIARRLCDSCATCLCLRQSRLAEGIMFSTCTSVTNHENTIFWIRINRFFCKLPLARVVHAARKRDGQLLGSGLPRSSAKNFH